MHKVWELGKGGGREGQRTNNKQTNKQTNKRREGGRGNEVEGGKDVRVVRTKGSRSKIKRSKAPFSMCVHVSPLQDNLGLESECDWGVPQMKKAELVLPAVSSPSQAQSPAHHKCFRKTVS